MGDRADLGKAFTSVDSQADPARLVAGMDATAQWPAVKRLRAWEQERLNVQAGDDVLDIGCGTGAVLLELASVAGTSGRLVGIDASEAMLSVATQRAAAAGISATFERGDATALEREDASFDVVRSERTLQWVADPAKAVAEMARVTRPGGRVSVIDTDWRTMIVDHPHPELAQTFFEALGRVRGDQISVGGRLVNLVREAGLTDIDVSAETHIWLAWDPDQGHLPGFFPLRMVAADLVSKGLLEEPAATTMIDEFENAARRDRFFVALTMFAVVARAPGV